MQKTFQSLLGLVFFGGVIVALYYLISWFVDVFRTLSPNVAASIVAASATVTVSVLTVIVGRRIETVSAIRKEHRDKKVPVYEELMAFMSKMFARSRSDEEIPEEEMVSFMYEFTPKMMIWGGDEVVASWSRFRTASIGLSPEEAGKKVIFEYENLVMAIRKDLGHANKGLGKGSILAFFVNDIQDHLS
jgi:hypothetical protein